MAERSSIRFSFSECASGKCSSAERIPTQPLAIRLIQPSIRPGAADHRPEMLNVVRFSIVLVAFVASLTAVVWTTASTERAIGARESDEREAAHGMRDALLARESALRGYAVSGTRRLSAAVRRGHRGAGGGRRSRARFADADDTEERALIAEQERLAERWAGIANDMIIRVKNGRPVSAESSDAGTDVIERFKAANDALVERDRGGERERRTAMRSSGRSC